MSRLTRLIPPPTGGGGVWPRAKPSAARGSPIPPKRTHLPRQGQRIQSPALGVVPVGLLLGRLQPTGQCRHLQVGVAGTFITPVLLPPPPRDGQPAATSRMLASRPPREPAPAIAAGLEPGVDDVWHCHRGEAAGCGLWAVGCRPDAWAVLLHGGADCARGRVGMEHGGRTGKRKNKQTQKRRNRHPGAPGSLRRSVASAPNRTPGQS
jgi:hypothetical protein